MTTHQSRCEELATELERLNARANPGDGTDWLSACEDLGEFYAANTREIIALLRSLASQPAGVTPGHTDLMVSLESLDAFMEANPLPVSEADVVADELEALECFDLSPRLKERIISALRSQPAGGASTECEDMPAAEFLSRNMWPAVWVKIDANTADDDWNGGTALNARKSLLLAAREGSDDPLPRPNLPGCCVLAARDRRLQHW